LHKAVADVHRVIHAQQRTRLQQQLATFQIVSQLDTLDIPVRHRHDKRPPNAQPSSAAVYQPTTTAETWLNTPKLLSWPTVAGLH